MFYAIIAILLLMYYIFIAPKTIKNTMNMISVVGIIAFVMVLAGMTFIRIIQSPPEIFIGIGMIIVGYYALKDVLHLRTRPKNKR
ncbi:DUF3165 family protein [Streptococcus mutans]|uniref:DUF3165 family protein n=1 Tax=Streptococcus mutans TaxID=1309 RepID=UPI0023B00748|nr:DUF3165 family protein [Streptococcus mutans]MDE8030878.1 DUF3165 family protein [Streptococcus mutans]MDT9487650.1 DUF3165 family protein [Streptococcus mutans]MDT9491326.1 DUF3165 family protein [Streptococcus mutans]MDT9508365.1 DUF3165 family protein [Streptococcus mutans]MDT9532243.1 DUF3165 family protein [Streptococcus mutans]